MYMQLMGFLIYDRTVYVALNESSHTLPCMAADMATYM